jgi:hypothetical protein
MESNLATSQDQQPQRRLAAPYTIEDPSEMSYSSIGKVLRQRLRASIEVISHESPFFAETLNTLQQLIYAELGTLRAGYQADLRTEAVTMPTEEALMNLKKEVGALKKDLTELQCQLHSTREELSLADLTISQCLPEPLSAKEPAWIYSYQYNSDMLWRTSLITGEESCHHLPSYKFKTYCCWSELPNGSLLVTGGDFIAPSKEVVRIDTPREFGVTREAPMLTRRCLHAAVYHPPHLYVLGGHFEGDLAQCERYAGAWEALPPLPRA